MTAIKTMQKIIKQVTGEIVQVTIADERWYVRQGKNPITGLPENQFVPSVTWICGSYPKGKQFWHWLADKGWDEAEAIKSAAGDKGSKVHQAIVNLLNGNEVVMEDKYLNNTTEQPEELTLEEYECIMSFSKWYEETKPVILNKEFVVWNDEFNYAGTVDLLCRINGEIWLIDLKTSQNIWPEYELQVSAYKHALLEDKLNVLNNISPKEVLDWANLKLGILQIGYRRNKNVWKFTEIEDKFDLFQSALKIWHNENAGVEPKAKDLPLKIKLQIYETNNHEINSQPSANQIRPKRKVRAAISRKVKRLDR